jgi:hypothetical protein
VCLQGRRRGRHPGEERTLRLYWACDRRNIGRAVSLGDEGRPGHYLRHEYDRNLAGSCIPETIIPHPPSAQRLYSLRCRLSGRPPPLPMPSSIAAWGASVPAFGAAREPAGLWLINAAPTLTSLFGTTAPFGRVTGEEMRSTSSTRRLWGETDELIWPYTSAASPTSWSDLTRGPWRIVNRPGWCCCEV